jgi:hypothetical protein
MPFHVGLVWPATFEGLEGRCLPALSTMTFNYGLAHGSMPERMPPFEGAVLPCSPEIGVLAAPRGTPISMVPSSSLASLPHQMCRHTLPG